MNPKVKDNIDMSRLQQVTPIPPKPIGPISNGSAPPHPNSKPSTMPPPPAPGGPFGIFEQ